MSILTTFESLINSLKNMYKLHKNNKMRVPSHLRGLEVERFYLVRNIKNAEINLSLTLDSCEMGNCCQFCVGGPGIEKYYLIESGLDRKYERLKQIDASLEKKRLKKLKKGSKE